VPASQTTSAGENWFRMFCGRDHVINVRRLFSLARRQWQSDASACSTISSLPRSNYGQTREFVFGYRAPKPLIAISRLLLPSFCGICVILYCSWYKLRHAMSAQDANLNCVCTYRAFCVVCASISDMAFSLHDQAITSSPGSGVDVHSLHLFLFTMWTICLQKSGVYLCSVRFF